VLLSLSDSDPINNQYINSLHGDNVHKGVFSYPFIYFSTLWVKESNFDYFNAVVQSNRQTIDAYSQLMIDRTTAVNAMAVRNYVEVCNAISSDIYNRDKVGAMSYFIKLNGKLSTNKKLAEDVAKFYALLPLAHAELQNAERVWGRGGDYYYLFQLRDVANQIQQELQ
jgi:hypothetical protein